MDSGTRLGTVAVLRISAVEEAPGTSVGPTSLRITGQLPGGGWHSFGPSRSASSRIHSGTGFTRHIAGGSTRPIRLSRDRILTTQPSDRFRVDDSDRPRMARTSILMAAITEPQPGTGAAGVAMATDMVTAMGTAMATGMGTGGATGTATAGAAIGQATVGVVASTLVRAGSREVGLRHRMALLGNTVGIRLEPVVVQPLLLCALL